MPISRRSQPRLHAPLPLTLAATRDDTPMVMTQHAPAFFLNLEQRSDATYDAPLQSILSLAGARAAQQAISAWEGYAPTPLRSLDAMARDAQVARVQYKDEGLRFSLKAFKGLGGAYAVERLVRQRGTSALTVTCATDGNHGRAVAWGARRAGIRAVIYVHETVSQGRADAIAALGATVVREGRTYDDAVRASAEAAAKKRLADRLRYLMAGL